MTTIFLTAFCTVLVVAILLNFTPAEKKIDKKIVHQYSVDDPLFQTSVGHLLGPPLVTGNNVEILKNGDQIFPAMLTAILEAKSSICFETFIYWSGEIGNTFAQTLIKRAIDGIAVHVILDYVGALPMDSSLIDRMREAGVQVVQYHPLRWFTLTRMNHRTHRKLLVIDGKTGFIGGVGIADKWLGNADTPDHWRDTHIKLTGPVVADLQSAFMDNWLKTKSQVLHGEKYFPVLSDTGSVYAQVFKSSSSEGGESARLLFLLSIASAKHSILIGASYFVPDNLAIAELCEARKRGVTVEVIVPGPYIDTRGVQIVSRSLWGPLLRAGVKIYEYQPTMYHTKQLVVDGVWSSVGSANFDNRSFRLNDEANLNCLDRSIAETFTKHFTEDRAHSKEVTYAEWQRRSFKEKVAAFIYRPLRSQL